jgi:tetratricopeptide (TPR) repeat protein
VICWLKSRAAILGFTAAAIFILWRSGRLTIMSKKILLLPVFLACVLLFLFIVKHDSSSGRLHIYDISLQILKDNWLTGVGIGKFKAAFNEYQAAYFMQHDIDSKRALLADNTFYAFNDYLQWMAETGIIGLVILILLTGLLINRIKYLLKQFPENPVILGAAASLLSVSVAALFSYPFQVLPIQFLVLLNTGIIIFYPAGPETKRNILYTTTIRFALIGTLLFFFYHSFLHIKAKKRENKAFQLSLSGRKTEALNEYKKLAIQYPVYGHNQYLYAEHLYYINQLAAADSSLTEALKRYSDNRVYSLKARICSETGKIQEAEKYFLKAVYMVPNRMTSRYELVNFYLENKDTMNALKWAYSVSNMPVKVPSEKTKMMKNRVNELIKKLQ